MINMIPGGFLQHARDYGLHENPGFFRIPFEAPSPTFWGGSPHVYPERSAGANREGNKVFATKYNYKDNNYTKGEII